MQHPDTPPRPDENVAGIVQATADSLPHQPDVLTRVRAFAQPLLANMTLPSGENTFVHAEGVAHVLAHIGSAANLQAVAYLVYAAEHLNRPQELIEQVVVLAGPGRTRVAGQRRSGRAAETAHRF